MLSTPTELTAAEVSRGVIERLDGAILLAGSVRSSRMSRALDRPLTELPVDAERTLMHHWVGELESLGLGTLPARVMVDARSDAPSFVNEAGSTVTVTVERDPNEYRGTGGILADLVGDYDDDAYLLVANAHQLLVESLRGLVSALAMARGDVALVGHRDGTPCGMFLVRCGALRAIPRVGFVDLKEQALPIIAERHRVVVVARATASGLPVRTLAEYLYALRMHHLRQTDAATAGDNFAEGLEPAFAVVERGAEVDDSARLHDSVVLRGAQVNAGAVVVRSVVGPGAIVPRYHHVIDRLMAGSARRRRSEG